MSNTNAPFGFRWIGAAGSASPVTGGTITRKIAAGNNTPICFGDGVQSLATGYVGIAAAGVAVSQWAGIFVGCSYLSTARGERVYSSYWPNGDHAYDGEAYIIPIAGAPPQLFEVQALSTYFTFADIGANVDIDVGTQTISGGRGLSGMTVSKATLATTATLPFRIVDLLSSSAPYGAPGTDDLSNYNIVIVQSNPAGETGIVS